MFEQLWIEGPTICEVAVEQPLVAQWEAKTNPAQIRLRDYLNKLVLSLTPLPAEGLLCLHYEICIADARHLLSGCDLENFLTPMFGKDGFPHNRFSLVSARKSLGPSSSIRVGYAIGNSTSFDGWFGARVHAGSGSSNDIWKERIRDVLAVEAKPLGAGSVAVQIAFRCSPQRRNWTNLWKSSGDAMGPILGVTRESGFNPCDDRIVDLRFHSLDDPTLKNDVHLGYWWRRV